MTPNILNLNNTSLPREKLQLNSEEQQTTNNKVTPNQNSPETHQQAFGSLPREHNGFRSAGRMEPPWWNLESLNSPTEEQKEMTAQIQTNPVLLKLFNEIMQKSIPKVSSRLAFHMSQHLLVQKRQESIKYMSYRRDPAIIQAVGKAQPQLNLQQDHASGFSAVSNTQQQQQPATAQPGFTVVPATNEIQQLPSNLGLVSSSTGQIDNRNKPLKFMEQQLFLDQSKFNTAEKLNLQSSKGVQLPTTAAQPIFTGQNSFIPQPISGSSNHNSESSNMKNRVQKLAYALAQVQNVLTPKSTGPMSDNTGSSSSQFSEGLQVPSVSHVHDPIAQTNGLMNSNSAELSTPPAWARFQYPSMANPQFSGQKSFSFQPTEHLNFNSGSNPQPSIGLKKPEDFLGCNSMSAQMNTSKFPMLVQSDDRNKHVLDLIRVISPSVVERAEKLEADMYKIANSRSDYDMFFSNKMTELKTALGITSVQKPSKGIWNPLYVSGSSTGPKLPEASIKLPSVVSSTDARQLYVSFPSDNLTERVAIGSNGQPIVVLSSKTLPQQPQQQPSSGTIKKTFKNNNSDPVTQQQLIRKQIILIAHANDCQGRKRPEKYGCSSGYCIFRFLNHAKTCVVAGQNCKVRHCFSTKRIIDHTKKCMDPDCFICLLLKEPEKELSTEDAGMDESEISEKLSDEKIFQFIDVRNQTLNEIIALPVHCTKEWHMWLNIRTRNEKVHELVQMMIPISDPTAPLSDKRMNGVVALAKKYECDICKKANSRLEYEHLLTEKKNKIQKELVKERKQQDSFKTHQETQTEPISGNSSPEFSNSSHELSHLLTLLGKKAFISAIEHIKPIISTEKSFEQQVQEKIAQAKQQSTQSLKTNENEMFRLPPRLPMPRPNSDPFNVENLLQKESNSNKVKKEEFSPGKKIPGHDPTDVTETCLIEPDEISLIFTPIHEKLLQEYPESRKAKPGRADYYDTLKKNFSMIKVKLDHWSYTDPWQYVNDVWLTLKDADLYSEDTKIQDYFIKMGKIFIQEIEPVMEILGYCQRNKKFMDVMNKRLTLPLHSLQSQFLMMSIADDNKAQSADGHSTEVSKKLKH